MVTGRGRRFYRCELPVECLLNVPLREKTFTQGNVLNLPTTAQQGFDFRYKTID